MGLGDEGFAWEELACCPMLLHPRIFSHVAPEKRWLEDDPVLLGWYLFKGYVKLWGSNSLSFGIPGIPSRLVFLVIFPLKTIVLLKDFQPTNPGDSHFYSRQDLPGFSFS